MGRGKSGEGALNGVVLGVGGRVRLGIEGVCRGVAVEGQDTVFGEFHFLFFHRGGLIEEALFFGLNRVFLFRFLLFFCSRSREEAGEVVLAILDV